MSTNRTNTLKELPDNINERMRDTRLPLLWFRAGSRKRVACASAPETRAAAEAAHLYDCTDAYIDVCSVYVEHLYCRFPIRSGRSAASCSTGAEERLRSRCRCAGFVIIAKAARAAVRKKAVSIASGSGSAW